MIVGGRTSEVNMTEHDDSKSFGAWHGRGVKKERA